ncbi:MAG: hypothetical protein P8X47_11800 [Ignavibacteriaceae bacterium]
MKRIIIFSAVLFAMFSFNLQAQGMYRGVSGYFYSELVPYGSWIEVDRGVVVWRPTIIRRDWMPYTMGRWIWSDCGWYWDSYEPFGYITFHYGRWFYDDYYGWLWYPDYEWAPAWVEWRYDNDYIGWAPLNPYAVFTISVGIHFTTVYTTPYYHWHFVTYKHFYDPYVYNYYVAPNYRYRVYSRTKYRTNYGFYNGRIQNRGVDLGYIRTRSGKEIRERDLVRVNDSRELNRDSYGKRDEIRTLDIKREVLERNDLNRMEIKRESRETSFNLDRVEMGKRKIQRDQTNDFRNVERNVSIQKNENTQRVDVKRNTEVKVNRKIEDNKTINRSSGNNNSTERNTKRSNEQVRTEKKVNEINRTRTNESVNRNSNIREQRTNVKTDNTSRNDEKVRVNTNNSRDRNVERKVNTNKTEEKNNSRERTRR